VTHVIAFANDAWSKQKTTGMSATQIRAATAAEARACRAKLDTASIPTLELPSLARLHAISGDTAAAVATIRRYVALDAPNASVRAERAVAALPTLIALRSDDMLSIAEQLTATIDTLHDAPLTRVVAAHTALLDYYRAVDVDDRMDLHARRIIALAPSLTPADRKVSASGLRLAYTSLAEVYGDRAQADSAVGILTRGEHDLADLPAVVQTLRPVRDRYALVGTHAKAIVAPAWLDSAGVTTPSAAGTKYDPTGHVTIVEFTAHWCGPCRKSYPTMARLQQRYASRGVQTVFVTSLFGFFKDRQNLTPDDELKADHEYYFKEHELPIRVAVTPAESDDAANAVAPDLYPNTANYHVAGIPHIVVIDRTGTIRMIVIGWDPASEARLASMLDALTATPVATR